MEGAADRAKAERVVRYKARKLAEGDYEGFVSELCSYLDTSVRRTANLTTMANAKRDRRRYGERMRRAGVHGVRFARIPRGGETCTFCAMLASRGFVYWTEETAGKFDHFHNRCKCRIVASTDADVEGYDPTEWYARWKAYEEIDADEGLTDEMKRAEKANVGIGNSVGAALPSSKASSNVILKKEQFGKKARKHARDWGLDPSSKADRDGLERIIEDIIDNADAVDSGDWRDQPNPCTFYRKGDDLVIVDADDQFVTVMKGGGSNKRYRNAISGQGNQVQGNV